MNKLIKIIYLVCTFSLLFLCVKGQPDLREMKKADSLYFAQDWVNAKKAYESVLTDTSRNGIAWNRLGFANYSTGNYKAALNDYGKALAAKPASPVKASVYSHMARIYALEDKKSEALGNIDSAAAYGYLVFAELDSLKDFNSIRNDDGFKKLREKVYLAANPCMADPRAREFDFWAGRWDVYASGTNILVGHSLVEVVSGGCALLENWASLGNVSTGKSLNFIDNAGDMWRQCWVGSFPKSKQDFVNGVYKDGAMRFTYSAADAQGRTITGRFIFFNEGPDKVRQLNETSADGGKTWVTSYDFTYIREKN